MKKKTSRELLGAIASFFVVLLILVLAYMHLYDTENGSSPPLDKEFIKGIHVETFGFMMDIVLFSIIFFLLRKRDNHEIAKRQLIERNNEIIDDLRGWDSLEASYRLSGAISRLIANGATPDLYGVCLSNISLPERGVITLENVNFFAKGKESRLKNVAFRDLNCRNVQFSQWDGKSEGSSSWAILDDDPYDVLERFKQLGIHSDLIKQLTAILDRYPAKPGDFEYEIAGMHGERARRTFKDDPDVNFVLQLLDRLRMPCAFQGIDLDFRGVDLTGANFSGARLIWTDYSSAPFEGACLRNTCFSGATIIGANIDRNQLIGFGNLDLTHTWAWPGLEAVENRPFEHYSRNKLHWIDWNTVKSDDSVDIKKKLKEIEE